MPSAFKCLRRAKSSSAYGVQVPTAFKCEWVEDLSIDRATLIEHGPLTSIDSVRAADRA